LQTGQLAIQSVKQAENHQQRRRGHKMAGSDQYSDRHMHKKTYDRYRIRMQLSTGSFIKAGSQMAHYCPDTQADRFDEVHHAYFTMRQPSRLMPI